MREATDMFRLFSDESRLRILLLLSRKELCVCQIMGVLDMSQPLISRNLSLLHKAGFLSDRREGKLIFYSLKKKLPEKHLLILSLLKELLHDDNILQTDLDSLRDCDEFQKKTGKCNMETLRAFRQYKQKKALGGRQVV